MDILKSHRQFQLIARRPCQGQPPRAQVRVSRRRRRGKIRALTAIRWHGKFRAKTTSRPTRPCQFAREHTHMRCQQLPVCQFLPPIRHQSRIQSYDKLLTTW